MANLVIMESPTKAGTVKSYLGSGYKVVGCTGHIRDLPKSTLGIDVDNDFAAKYINIRGKGDLIKELKKEAKKADKVFLATDPDREGEAIAWHLSEALDIPDSKVRRVTFNEITKKAVKAGMKNPREIDMGLVNSQQARRILDRIVGYKLSPFLWKTIKSGLSAGRVQSVATRILVEREEEIRAFVPEEYWTVDVVLENKSRGKIKAKFYGDASGKLALRTEAEAMKVVNAIEGKEFAVKSVKKAIRYKNPAPPFTTSTMQQEASRRLGFQSQRIMRVAQELYEGINLGSLGGVQGLITYMRTDSLRIADEAADGAQEFITKKYGEEFYPKERRIYKTKVGAQDAHEAIRPSNLTFEPEKIKKMLTSDQYRLYKLIWDRFMASQMASAELDTVTADIEAGGYIFRSSGYTVKFQGYMALYEEAEDYVAPNVADADTPEKSVRLPKIDEGDILKHDETKPSQHFTEAPPRYNEASLVKFLEERGIGRPSTFATIITTIIARGYVVREAKSLKPTELGEVTTKLMVDSFPKVVDYEFTANMETDLDEIANGIDTVSGVLRSFYDDFANSLAVAEATVDKSKYELPVEKTDIICDKCGSVMIVKNGRFGKFAACPNYPACRNTKPLTKEQPEVQPKQEKTTDMVCDKCGSPMVMRTGRFGSFYACSRYPECKTTRQITKELGVDCPKCGSKVVIKKGKNRTVFYSCEKYPECDFSSWDMPTNEKCPSCGDILFRKKGKPVLICKHDGCSYKREIEENDGE